MAARSSGLQSGLGHPKRCADEKYTLTVGNGPSHRSGIRGLGTETSLLPGTQSALSGSSANAAASANSERRVIAIEYQIWIQPSGADATAAASNKNLYRDRDSRQRK